MSIVMPGILFWLLVLIIWWIFSYWWSYDPAVDGPRFSGLVCILFAFIGTFVYIIYAIYWLYTRHWCVPIHINLT